jgi:hypothetical protein
MYKMSSTVYASEYVMHTQKQKQEQQQMVSIEELIQIYIELSMELIIPNATFTCEFVVKWWCKYVQLTLNYGKLSVVYYINYYYRPDNNMNLPKKHLVGFHDVTTHRSLSFIIKEHFNHKEYISVVKDFKNRIANYESSSSEYSNT